MLTVVPGGSAPTGIESVIVAPASESLNVVASPPTVVEVTGEPRSAAAIPLGAGAEARSDVMTLEATDAGLVSAEFVAVTVKL